MQGSVDRQADAVRDFFTKAGFKPDDFTDSDISLMRDRPRDAYGNPLPENLTVSRTIQLRTNDVMKARAAYAKQADLLRAGVEMGGGSVNYTFTGLNELKPDMIAEANRSARESAQQFANDSGASVGRIKTASQGYFSIGARDGVECEYCDSSGANTPFQKVRVVTTVAYELN